jgi:hypothetical protein
MNLELSFFSWGGELRMSKNKGLKRLLDRERSNRTRRKMHTKELQNVITAQFLTILLVLYIYKKEYLLLRCGASYFSLRCGRRIRPTFVSRKVGFEWNIRVQYMLGTISDTWAHLTTKVSFILARYGQIYKWPKSFSVCYHNIRFHLSPQNNFGTCLRKDWRIYTYEHLLHITSIFYMPCQ